MSIKVLPALLLVASASCGVGEQGALPYQATGDRDAVLEATEGWKDPVALYLRGAIGERGTVRGSYRDLLAGLGKLTGCADDTEKSFVVLSNAGFIPKFVFTRCSADAAAASRFFVALPAQRDDGDVETGIVHVAGWDDEAGVYHYYSLAPTPGTTKGEMAVDVQPGFCLNCHGGPYHVGKWQPLMNEMTNPWSHWDARPGFASLLFDENLEPGTATRPNYRQAAGRLSSAAELEPLVRAGIERFVTARLRSRAAAADVEAALALTRPLFCDETVNFVSEIHDTGELRSSSVIDDGLRALLREARPGRWAFTDEPTLTLPPVSGGERPLALVPVRGTSTIEAELGLVSRGVLSVEDALRVRAVDFARPVFSEVRCGLWESARARAGGLAGATTGDLAAAIVLDALAPLGEAAPGQVITAAGAAPVSIDELGDQVSARLRATTRASLAAERKGRVCRATDAYPSAPIIDDVDCGG